MSSKIDFATMSGSGHFYIGDILVQFGSQMFANQSFNNEYYGNLKRGNDGTNKFAYSMPFGAKPKFIARSSTNGIVGVVERFEGSATESPGLTFVGGNSLSGNIQPSIDWIAIGPKA